MEKKIAVLKSKMLAYTILLVSVYSCNFAQSVNKDLVTGMVTRGNGLTCDEVYLASEREVLKRNTFTYGEAFVVNFDGIEGFNRTGQAAFPGMQLVVVSQQGDTANKFKAFNKLIKKSWVIIVYPDIRLSSMTVQGI